VAADLPTFNDLFRVSRDEILARNSRLTRDVIERPGTDANALVAADATVGDELVGQIARVDAAQFLDSAKGQALTRLVFDRYNITRKPAAAARVTVNFSTTASTITSFSIPAGTRMQTTDGTEFVTSVNATYPSSSMGPIPVSCRSSKAGLSQQAQKATITNLVDVPAGAPADLKITNPLASAGADDEEQDGDLSKRARDFFLTARRGTLAAIEQAALAVPGVRRAEAFEAIDSGGRPARYVELVVADAFTDALVGSATIPPAYAAQSQVLAQEIGSTALDDARAAGVYVRVTVAQVILLPIQLGLTFAAGLDPDPIAFAARAVIVGFVNGLVPGQIFDRAAAAKTLQSIAGLVVGGSEIVSPPGNIQPETLQVLRTSLSLVAAVSLQPDQQLQGSSTPH
jgi:hypothetical protein